MTYLPPELQRRILYGYGGLEHPAAHAIKEHWAYMEFEFLCFDDVQCVEREILIEYAAPHMTVTKVYTNVVTELDTPRLFFPPSSDQCDSSDDSSGDENWIDITDSEGEDG